jgi:hypothetical protein
MVMETFIWFGLGVGLASVAGVRAFVPLALYMLFAQLGYIVPPDLLGLPGDWALVGAFSALAVVEILLDKVLVLDPWFGYAMVVVRASAGAVLFETMFEPGAPLDGGAVPGLVLGGGIAAFVAVLKLLLRPASGTESAGVSTAFLSAIEDVVAILGGLIGLFLPFVPLILVGFLLFFFNRIRKRRGRKYGGLRILGD